MEENIAFLTCYNLLHLLKMVFQTLKWWVFKADFKWNQMCNKLLHFENKVKLSVYPVANARISNFIRLIAIHINIRGSLL